MSVVAFIFARGGSKGLINKNLRLLGGKPLIGLAIECSLAVKKIERVIVSTDSFEIADIAREFGAEVPFMRPADLATDTSSEWLSWQHGLNFLLETTGFLPKAMLSVPPTAPLRSHLDVENCLNRFLEMNFDVVVSVTEAHRNPFFNMVVNQPDGTVELVATSESVFIRRQDAPRVYDMTTVCYAAKPEFVLENNSMFAGKVGAVVVPPERAIDIDTQLDFQIAEALYGKIGGN